MPLCEPLLGTEKNQILITASEIRRGGRRVGKWYFAVTRRNYLIMKVDS